MKNKILSIHPMNIGLCLLLIRKREKLLNKITDYLKIDMNTFFG